MIHHIRIKHFRGIEGLRLEPEPRTFLASKFPGAGKSTILRAVQYVLMGRCPGTDARGAGAKHLIRQGQEQARVEVAIQTPQEILCLGRTIDRDGTKATYTCGIDEDPDWGSPLDAVIEKELGVPGDALLPLFQPIEFLSLKTKEQQGIFLAASGAFTFAELAKRSGQDTAELQALCENAEGLPLREAAGRLHRKATGARREADKLVQSTTGGIASADAIAKDRKPAPKEEELEAASAATTEAREGLQKLESRAARASDAASQLANAEKKLERAAADEGSKAAYKKLTAATTALKKAKQALQDENSARKQRGQEAVGPGEYPDPPSDVAVLVEAATKGCPVVVEFDKVREKLPAEVLRGKDCTCMFHRGGGEALADALRNLDGQNGAGYERTVALIGTVEECLADHAKFSAEVHAAGAADDTQKHQAAVEAAQEAVKAAGKPVTESKLAAAKQAVADAEQAEVDLKAAAQAATESAGVDERLASLRQMQGRATADSERWAKWEKVCDPAGKVMLQWGNAVSEQWVSGLPVEMRALEGGDLMMGEAGPEVDGLGWRHLSRGEQTLLGVAVAKAWAIALGLQFAGLDDVDALGGRLEAVLRYLNSNGEPTGSVLLAGVGTQAAALANETGWGVQDCGAA